LTLINIEFMFLIL